jgi:hypothetical protein
MSVVTLRPGLLVSLSTRMSGGVTYNRVDLDKDKPADGPSVEKWETTKVVTDPQEYARATKARSKCGSLVRSACSYSAFGLLCPGNKEEMLDAAIKEARDLANAFNRTAKTVQISVYVLKGRIAETDGEAARAISSEMRELIDDMRAGIAEVDVNKVREAAMKAKKIGAMLDADTGAKVAKAVEEARAVAKEIVKRMVDDADSVAGFVQDVALKSMDEARFAFLDLDAPEASDTQAAPPVAPSVLDLDDERETGDGGRDSLTAN